ncbi:MAG TPA: ArsR family transcriptional regulator [Candidatus Methanoperedenaceae archaeon]|nr:ArsR family transcriptional regulator [Candidatus Methanoperedenaceae archaeon]
MIDTSMLLDILGNQNRRKILNLLAGRPCYMSEIAERLDVGAKAVLSHLEMLERAGLVQGSFDNRRRKYFRISDTLHIEIFLSPYSYDEGSATVSVRQAANDAAGDAANLSGLSKELAKLEDVKKELARQQEELYAQITELRERCISIINHASEDYLEAGILYELLRGPRDLRSLSIRLAVPEYVIEGYVERMKEKGIVKTYIKMNTQYIEYGE